MGLDPGQRGSQCVKLRTMEITPPSLADTCKLLAATDEYDVELAALLRVLAATGVRRGEVCRLRCSDIDRGARALSIKRSIATVPGGTKPRPAEHSLVIRRFLSGHHHRWGLPLTNVVVGC